MNNIKIGVIGLGMVGSPIKRYFEEVKGYERNKDLFCYDIDPKKGFFDNINQADVIFVCVPTPNGPHGTFNLSAVRSTIEMLEGEKVVVIKSTVLPTTTVALQKEFSQHRIMFNPEFLTESQAWNDFIRPDRQIIGGTEKSYSSTSEVLSLLPQAPYMTPGMIGCYESNRTSATEAEMAKVAANVFGSIKVVFGNVLADVALALKKYLIEKGLEDNIEYNNVKKIIGADHRIGSAWLDVDYGDYCGFGGYCFPKDTKSFIHMFDELVSILEKDNKNIDLIKCLKAGQNVFKSIWDYNETLLSVQNLTVEDVSLHDKYIVLEKRKKIRE